MHSTDWLQLGLYVAALALITKPMGLYLIRVLDASGKTWLDPVLRPLERVTYRLMRACRRETRCACSTGFSVAPRARRVEPELACHS